MKFNPHSFVRTIQAMRSAWRTARLAHRAPLALALHIDPSGKSGTFDEQLATLNRRLAAISCPAPAEELSMSVRRGSVSDSIFADSVLDIIETALGRDLAEPDRFRLAVTIGSYLTGHPDAPLRECAEYALDVELESLTEEMTGLEELHEEYRRAAQAIEATS